TEEGSTHGSIGSVALNGNAAVYYGGAIYAVALDSFQVSNATFGWNKAEVGGAVLIALSGGKTSELSNCMFDGKEAGDGGAVYLYTGAGVDIFTSSVLRHNSASR
ncbi:unnamed protein product, partial [Laminaria digitata]